MIHGSTFALFFLKGRKQPARARSTMEPFAAAQGLVIVLQRSHARAYDDPLNKPNVQTTKTSEKTNPPARSCPPCCHQHHLHPSLLPDISPPPALLLVTSPPCPPPPPPPPPPQGSVTRRGGAFSVRFLRRRPGGCPCSGGCFTGGRQMGSSRSPATSSVRSLSWSSTR